MDGGKHKKLVWIGSSRKDLKTFPTDVRRCLGFSLYAAQAGEWPPDAKPLKHFGGAGVLEITEDHRGETYRAVFTVRFASAVYVLHAFQKKSKQGIATPKPDMDVIRERLKEAERLHAATRKEGEHGH